MVQPVKNLPSSSRKFLILSVISIALAGFLVYANSFRGDLLWDDEALVQHNPYIKDWSYLPQILTRRMGSAVQDGGAFYRPVQTLSYLVDYSFWRLNTTGYHAVNTVLHILTALGVFWLVCILFQNRRLALLTSLLFVVHPVHTEAVAYISGRADSLAGLFMLTAFVYYVKHDQGKKAWALLVMATSYVLALLSKELSLVLPALALVYHFAFRKTLDKKAFTLLAGIFVGYVLWRLMVVGRGSMADGAMPTLVERLPGVFIALLTYARLLIFPVNLHMEYGGFLFSFSEPRALVGLLLTSVILAYVVYKSGKDRFLCFAALWFAVTLLPSSNLLYPINAYMAEHWLYLPSVGFFLIVARLLDKGMDRKAIKGGAVVLAGGILVLLSGMTIRQNRVWQNGINFYQRMLQYAPGSSRLYNNLAKAYHDAGKTDELIELLQSAIRLQPDNLLAYNNLGNAYKDAGRYQEAVQAYQKAIEIDPTHAGPYYNLSTMYADILGDKQQAVGLLEKAIVLSPHFSKAYNKLGLVYLERGERDRAIGLLTKAMKLNPDDPEVYHNLGYIYFHSGNNEKAKEMYQKAIEADANYAQAYHDLAIIFLSDGDYRRAVEHGGRAEALGYRDPSLINALKPHR